MKKAAKKKKVNPVPKGYSVLTPHLTIKGAAQALDFLAPLKTSKRGQMAHAAIRSVCATMDKDRVMYQDFARIAELIASGKVAEALR